MRVKTTTFTVKVRHPEDSTVPEVIEAIFTYFNLGSDITDPEDAYIVGVQSVSTTEPQAFTA